MSPGSRGKAVTRILGIHLVFLSLFNSVPHGWRLDGSWRPQLEASHQGELQVNLRVLADDVIIGLTARQAVAHGQADTQVLLKTHK